MILANGQKLYCVVTRDSRNAIVKCTIIKCLVIMTYMHIRESHVTWYLKKWGTHLMIPIFLNPILCGLYILYMLLFVASMSFEHVTCSIAVKPPYT